MYKKIWISATSIVSVIALGAGATYALFTSNTVTLSNNTITTGEAAIKVCNATVGDQWDNSLATNFTLDGMVPGAAERQLTDGTTLFVGNDEGSLDNNLGGDCTTYNGAIQSNSSINVKLVPQIVLNSCPAAVADELELRFVIGGVDSGYGDITFWTTNAGVYGVQLDPDDTGLVQVYSQLPASATQQGETCTFDITFQGQQV